MGNTNFQTIHQMGGAISDLVKQATGRDDVQNIDMEHITVAQNHHYEEVDLSGQVVSFQAGEAGLPFEKLAVQIKPVQDLHGYDSPWPGGGGKNKADLTWGDYVPSINNGQNIRYSGWATDYIPVNPQNDYVVSVNGETAIRYVFFYSDDSWLGYVSYSSSKLLSTYENWQQTTRIRLRIDGTSADNPMCQLELGSSATTYAPYSNICPITGWTMVNVYQAGENMEDARVYRFTTPSEAGIVYGGTLDAISGKLVVDRANIDSYNGETLPGEWISDRDIYAEGTTPTTGAQVVYQLTTPITYHITPQEIATLLGQNYIWADTGDIEVKFTNVKEMY